MCLSSLLHSEQRGRLSVLVGILLYSRCALCASASMSFRCCSLIASFIARFAISEDSGLPCYRPCKVAQMWPSKSAHFRVRGAEAVGGWTRGWRVFWGWLGNLASPLNGAGTVIGREKRVLLRHHLEQGMPKAEIARHLKISRRTVYNWIEAGELDRCADSRAVRYGPRPPRPSTFERAMNATPSANQIHGSGGRTAACS